MFTEKGLNLAQKRLGWGGLVPKRYGAEPGVILDARVGNLIDRERRMHAFLIGRRGGLFQSKRRGGRRRASDGPSAMLVRFGTTRA